MAPLPSPTSIPVSLGRKPLVVTVMPVVPKASEVRVVGAVKTGVGVKMYCVPLTYRSL